MKYICDFCGKEYDRKSARSQTSHLARCKGLIEYKEQILTKEYLIEEYINRGRSANEIALEHKFKSACAIINLLKKHNIPTRSIKGSKNEREKLKRKLTNIERYGIEHNFSKNHPSRLKWEEKMFNEEGITNVYQRQEIIDKIRKSSMETKYRKGLCIRPELLCARAQYYHKVDKITYQNYIKYQDLIDPNSIREHLKYDLDHIYSKMNGFNNNIDPEIIGHPANLQILTSFDNRSKGSRSDISILELYRRIEEYEFCENKINQKNK